MKKALSFLLSLVMVLSAVTIIPVTARAEETVTSDPITKPATESAAPDEPITGVTGNCTWTLVGSELTISGNGAMENYTSFLMVSYILLLHGGKEQLLGLRLKMV